MTEPMRSNGRRRPDGRSVGRVSRQDWIDAARRALIDGGIEAIKVDRLARQMKITRGSFYWHFNARSDLLEALLEEWASTAVFPFAEVMDGEAGDPIDRFEALLDLFWGQGALDPFFEGAMRGWARVDERAEEAVRRADDDRIAVFERVFSDMGLHPSDARARARLGYYHQIGVSLAASPQAHEDQHTLKSELIRLMALPVDRTFPDAIVAIEPAS